MTVKSIRRLYNGQPNDYDRDLLETAWLVRAEVDSAFQNSRNSHAVRHLVDEHGWPLGVAIEYVVVASNWDGKD